MPRYWYQCTKCGATEHRMVSIAARDEQTCAALIDVVAAESADAQVDSASDDGMPARPDFPCLVHQTCGARLAREEISDGGTMNYQWSNWRR